MKHIKLFEGFDMTKESIEDILQELRDEGDDFEVENVFLGRDDGVLIRVFTKHIEGNGEDGILPGWSIDNQKSPSLTNLERICDKMIERLTKFGYKTKYEKNHWSACDNGITGRYSKNRFYNNIIKVKL